MDYSKAENVYLSMIRTKPTLRRDNFILKLMANGFDVNYTYCRRETPLHYAVCGPSVSVAHELIKKGADINVQDADGSSPLHEAVCTNNAEAICMLLYYGADVTLLNRHGYAPFVQGIQTCMCMYNVEVAGWLLNHYDKFRGRFTSMENYYYLFRIPIELPIDEDIRLRLVTQIWSKFDNETMLDSRSMYLTSYILDCRFSIPQWINGLYTMLATAGAEEVMAYKFNLLDEYQISHFEDVFFALQMRDSDPSDRAAVLSLWLSFGAQVCLRDLLRIYCQYGMNREMLLLIFATPVPLLTLLFALEECYGYERDLQGVFLYEFICNVRRSGFLDSATGFICKCLVYFSWGPFMRLVIETQCYEYMTEDDKEVLRALEKTPKVGSLVELCRNLVARNIQKNIFHVYKKIRTPMEYHQAVDTLEVTRDAKDILDFKRPLYI